MTRAWWVVPALMAAGFLSAHVADWAMRRGRSWWRRYLDAAWDRWYRRTGTGRWVQVTRQRRRREQEERIDQQLAAMPPEARAKLSRVERRAVRRLMIGESRRRERSNRPG